MEAVGSNKWSSPCPRRDPRYLYEVTQFVDPIQHLAFRSSLPSPSRALQVELLYLRRSWLGTSTNHRAARVLGHGAATSCLLHDHYAQGQSSRSKWRFHGTCDRRLLPCTWNPSEKRPNGHKGYLQAIISNTSFRSKITVKAITSNNPYWFSHIALHELCRHILVGTLPVIDGLAFILSLYLVSLQQEDCYSVDGVVVDSSSSTGGNAVTIST